MSPSVLSFDAAGTLIQVSWDPGRAACECATDLGLRVAEGDAYRYTLLLRERWSRYCSLHLRGSEADLDAFWDRLTEDWLKNMNLDPSWSEPLMLRARGWLYGDAMRYFSLYDDVLPCLDWATSNGLRLGLLSNWDYSLHRILKRLGVFSQFEVAIASLNVGPEKPDRRLFEHYLVQLGTTAPEVVHIGDDPVDDVEGALRAGMQAIWIDRTGQAGRIHSLVELPEVLKSI